MTKKQGQKQRLGGTKLFRCVFLCGVKRRSALVQVVPETGNNQVAACGQNLRESAPRCNKIAYHNVTIQ